MGLSDLANGVRVVNVYSVIESDLYMYVGTQSSQVFNNIPKRT